MYYVTFIGNIPLIPEGSKYVSGSSDELGLINPASTEKPIIMYCFQPHIWNIMCTILLYEVHERINHAQVCYVRFYGKVKMAAAKMTVIAPLFSS